ncbi:hypothetical protein X12_001172 [Xanthomonas arboricola]|uniref:hypothetical protein n=1 Tax=Xanthomonas arboricola TaxID=56448 RepID=UPI002B2A3DFC|nr:hypothetical protein X12_001172 [Xanthomonas arboricola]
MDANTIVLISKSIDTLTSKSERTKIALTIYLDAVTLIHDSIQSIALSTPISKINESHRAEVNYHLEKIKANLKTLEESYLTLDISHLDEISKNIELINNDKSLSVSNNTRFLKKI